MDSPLRIEDLIPDFSHFVQTSFDRQPVHYPGAMLHQLHLLPTAAALDGLLALDVLPPDSVRLTRAGRGMAKNAYTRMTGDTRAGALIDRSKVMQLFKSGATITINDVQQLWSDAMSLVRLLSESFACKSEAAVFATPAGRAGFSPHTDELGVLVVQAEGTKDWRVWPTDLEGPRTNTTFEDPALLGDPMLEVTLEPGDVLYLPHGTPHAAATTHEQSVHISLGLRPRGWHEIVSRIVSDTLCEGAGTEFPALTSTNLATLSDRVEPHLRALRRRLDDLDVEEALTSLREDLVSELVADVPGGLEDMRRLDECSADQLFRVSADAVEILEDGDADGRCKVRVDGVTMTLPQGIVATLTSRESEHKSLTCRQIHPGVPVSRAMSMAKQLTRLGALSLATADSPR